LAALVFSAPPASLVATSDDEWPPLPLIRSAPVVALDPIALASEDRVALAPLERALPTVPQVKGTRQARQWKSPLLRPLGRLLVALV
jgi:hypothetical protein